VLVQDILDSIDDHGFSDLTTAQKLKAVNDAYLEMAGRASWPSFTLSNTATVNNATGLVAFSATAFRVLEMAQGTHLLKEITPQVYFRAIVAKGLASATKDALQYYYRTQAASGGQPQTNVWPLPVTNNLSVSVLYMPQPTLLVQAGAESTILFPREFHWVILQGALKKLYALEDDLEEAAYFRTEYENGVATMMQSLLVKPEDRPRGETLIKQEEAAASDRSRGTRPTQ
jgi:hypothetical protein